MMYEPAAYNDEPPDPKNRLDARFTQRSAIRSTRSNSPQVETQLLPRLFDRNRLTIRNKPRGYEGIEETLTWTITSRSGIPAQISIGIVVPISIAVIDAL